MGCNKSKYEYANYKPKKRSPFEVEPGLTLGQKEFYRRKRECKKCSYSARAGNFGACVGEVYCNYLELAGKLRKGHGMLRQGYCECYTEESIEKPEYGHARFDPRDHEYIKAQKKLKESYGSLIKAVEGR